MRGEDWVACSDRMPDVGQNVLVWWHGVWYAAYAPDGRTAWILHDCKLANGLVSHWMPLPEPPGMESAQ